MHDPTEAIRRVAVNIINSEVESQEPENERTRLEAKHGKVWDTSELTKAFSVVGFMAPFVSVVEKITGNSGIMEFQDRPRFYFNFTK